MSRSDFNRHEVNKRYKNGAKDKKIRQPVSTGTKRSKGKQRLQRLNNIDLNLIHDDMFEEEEDY